MNFHKNILLLFVLLGVTSNAFTQDIVSYNDEAETLHIMTNQDIFFAGEKLWFGVKLLKNHESYRYSKLIYLDIYDPNHNLVHHEKLLLDRHEMTYGDVILPDNLAEGEYNIYAYTKWMLNFESYPIPNKAVLVKKFNPEPKAQEHIQFYYSEKEGAYRDLLLFHTGSKPFLVEIENTQGRQESVFEEVPPFKIYNTKIVLDTPKTIKWNNESHTVAPKAIHISNDRLEIDEQNEFQKFYIHTDISIIKEGNKNEEIILSSLPLDNISDYQVTLLDQQNQVVAHEYFSIEVKKEMTVAAPKIIKRGERFTANIRSNTSAANSGMAWLKSAEPDQVPEIIRVMNDPKWKPINNAGNGAPNYIITKLEIEQTQTPTYSKEHLPLMVYSPLTKTLKDIKPGLFLTSPLKSLPDFPAFDDYELNRKIFHEHFEYDAAVSIPVTPFTVDYTYDVQDYEGYKTIDIFMREVVSQVRIKRNKSTNQNEIRLFNPNMKKSDFKSIPLLLIDFYQINDPAIILDYDISQINRIELIYLRNTIDETNLGALSENGVIAFFTRKNDYQLKYKVPKDKFILKELSVPRIMAQDIIHPEASENITLKKPQTWHPAIPLERGKTHFQTSIIDEAGPIRLETWIFNGLHPTLIQTEIEVR